ncbi:MAG: ribosome rescue protein RqcH [Candidatus Thorarchaeota archaeon]
MLKIAKEFSNFDVYAIVKELDMILLNSSISNIYEVQDLLIVKINTDVGKRNLIIKKDSRINLTNYDYPIPEFPNQYIRTLRKFLKNRKILGISQHKFDRIIIIELSNIKGGSWKFVIELFNKGNFMLLDQSNIVLIAKKYKKFRDRSILAKRVYMYPKSQEKDFFTLKNEDFKLLIKDSDDEIVRDISRKLKISGLYSEEICYRANLNKKIISKDLSEEEMNKLYDTIKKLRNQLLFGSINAHIVLDQQNNEVAVLPFELEILAEYKKKFFPTYNEAVDDFYSKIDYDSIKTPKDQKINEQIKTQEKILENQQNYLEELKLKKQKQYEIGDFLYANLNKFENLKSVILDAREKGYAWGDINTKLQNAKKNKLDGAEFFGKILPSSNQLIVIIKKDEIYIDLKNSIGENANLIYAKGKKAEKKINGTLSAINETKEKIEKLKIKKELLEDEIKFLVKKPKKKWYEKFRWFESTDGFLIIGGRDASSNETIFKKHLEPNDLVFHTNSPGSPLMIIKNPDNKEIPERSIHEAADFVASYSRAWKENWGVVDVFYVNPSQVTKTPPSGEYLQKGSFIISGKKNIIKDAKTELTIGLKLVELESGSDNGILHFPKIICGPKVAIKNQTTNIITIVPSKSNSLTKGKLAKEIKSYFIRSVEKQNKKWVEILSIDDILLYLPNGSSKFKETT